MDLFVDWLAVLIIVALGIMIKYFKMSWLIAGYNTSSAEDRRGCRKKVSRSLSAMVCLFASILAGEYRQISG